MGNIIDEFETEFVEVVGRVAVAFGVQGVLAVLPLGAACRGLKILKVFECFSLGGGGKESWSGVLQGGGRCCLGLHHFGEQLFRIIIGPMYGLLSFVRNQVIKSKPIGLTSVLTDPFRVMLVGYNSICINDGPDGDII